MCCRCDGLCRSSLLMTWPEGARQRVGEGKFGRLPLQLAVTRQAPPEVVLRLLESYPEAVNAKNEADGKTVLMTAITAQAPDTARCCTTARVCVSPTLVRIALNRPPCLDRLQIAGPPWSRGRGPRWGRPDRSDDGVHPWARGARPPATNRWGRLHGCRPPRPFLSWPGPPGRRGRR